MNLLTIGDIIDTYIMLKQKGIGSILSKIGLKYTKRVQNKWNDEDVTGGYWNIPQIMKYCNELSTGNAEVEYPQYYVEKYLDNNSKYTMLSIGSGSGEYERKFARSKKFKRIVGIELSEKRVKEARYRASLENMPIKYICDDIYKVKFDNRAFDLVLFNASLHHFSDVDELLGGKIMKLLKDDGYLIINEYVGRNRLEIPREQLIAINKVLGSIPQKYRRYARTNIYKNKVYSPGKLRMLMNDPSEAVDSESIMPSIHKHYRTIEEKAIGLNIIMPLMRGIAHNFYKDNEEIKKIINKITEADGEYCKKNKVSDYIFGVYRKK